MVESIQKIREKIKKLLQRINYLESLNERLEEEKKTIIQNDALSIINKLDAIHNDYLDKIYSTPNKDLLKRFKIEYDSSNQALLELLEDKEISRLITPLDKIPDLCDIVGYESVHGKPDGVVVRVEKSGYAKGTDLIRPTQVVVVKNNIE